MPLGKQTATATATWKYQQLTVVTSINNYFKTQKLKYLVLIMSNFDETQQLN